MTIEEEIMLLKERNKKVDCNKAWEVSMTRRLSIIIITYILVSFVMYALNIDRYLINAIIPTLGFFLSTLSIEFLKLLWIKRIYKSS